MVSKFANYKDLTPQELKNRYDEACAKRNKMLSSMMAIDDAEIIELNTQIEIMGFLLNEEGECRS